MFLQKRSILPVFVALLALQTSARAATLAFTGTLSIQVSTLPTLAFPGAGTSLVNGAGGLGALASFTIPALAFSGAVSMPVTDPAQFPVAGLAATLQAGAGTLAPGGVLPVGGSVSICLQLPCATPYVVLPVPLTAGGTRGVGIGGGPILQAGSVNFTIQGAPWTTGAASVGTLGAAGFVHGPASGGASSAAQPGGALRLVTPIVVTTSLAAVPLIPMVGSLELRFVPEPGTLALVAAGAAGLGFAARTRRRGGVRRGQESQRPS